LGHYSITHSQETRFLTQVQDIRLTIICLAI
jgi:hypothetical protein